MDNTVYTLWYGFGWLALAFFIGVDYFGVDFNGFLRFWEIVAVKTQWRNLHVTWRLILPLWGRERRQVRTYHLLPTTFHCIVVPLTKPGVRDNFTATGAPKVFVINHRSVAQEEVALWPFCGPTKAIWGKFDLQRIQWVRYFASTTGLFVRWQDFHFTAMFKLLVIPIENIRTPNSLFKAVKWPGVRLPGLR